MKKKLPIGEEKYELKDSDFDGYEYKLAKKLVDRAIETGEEPLLGSWF